MTQNSLHLQIHNSRKKDTVGTTYALAGKIISTAMCDLTHLYWQNKLEKR